MLFHAARNGDELLLDLASPDGQPSVVSWGHETGEFRLLAPSLGDFLDRATALGCIGADEQQYIDFCDESGLNPAGGNSRRWSFWLRQYLTLPLVQARLELPQLILYTEMHGAGQEVLEGYRQFSPQAVLAAWLLRIRGEQESSIREKLLRIVGDVCGGHAAAWVRSLWTGAAPDAVSSHTRAYLSAACLPGDEGLQLVFDELELRGKQSRLSGYEGNGLLKPFRSRKVIGWMEDKAAFPFGGWDELFAVPVRRRMMLCTG